MLPRLFVPAALLLCSPLLYADKDLPAKGDAKVPEGFTPLFNGKDLTGWKVFKGKLSVWGADPKEKLLFVKGKGGGWLMTEKEYADFELRLEYKVQVNGNSGVALRAPLRGHTSRDGMEIQILDDNGPAYKKLKPWQYIGSIYGVVPPSKRATRPAGQWNRLRIVAKGRRVRVEVNGTKVVDANLDDYKEKHAKEHPGILRKKGHLGLQSHDGRVEFRNLFVKSL
jgi:hypothetical protein